MLNRSRAPTVRCCLLVAAMAAACGAAGPPLPPPPGPPPPALPDEATAVHRIRPGVLRGLMTAGSPRVEADAELRAAIAAAGSPAPTATVTVCVDEQGGSTAVLTRPSSLQAFDRAVLAVAGAWRFRPYQRDGVASRACSTAAFTAAADAGDALPPAELELPPAKLVDYNVPAAHRGRRATPGVAMTRVCRRQGSRSAPQQMWLQSSGDVEVDRELLGRPVIMRADEPADDRWLCWVATSIAGTSPPTAPVVVEPDDMGTRLEGERNIFPSDDLKTAIQASGRHEFVVAVEVCIDETGRPAMLTLRGSSGWVGYDMDLVNGIATWRYRPAQHGGRPVPVCAVVRFSYRQS